MDKEIKEIAKEHLKEIEKIENEYEINSFEWCEYISNYIIPFLKLLAEAED